MHNLSHQFEVKLCNFSKNTCTLKTEINLQNKTLKKGEKEFSWQQLAIFSSVICRDLNFAASQYWILKQPGNFKILLFLSIAADDSRQQNRAANNLQVRIATLTPFTAPRRLQLPLVNVLTATTLFTTLSQATALQQMMSKNTLIKLIDKIFIKLFAQLHTWNLRLEMVILFTSPRRGIKT